jgi:hypothetical protein
MAFSIPPNGNYLMTILPNFLLEIQKQRPGLNHLLTKHHRKVITPRKCLALALLQRQTKTHQTQQDNNLLLRVAPFYSALPPENRHLDVLRSESLLELEDGEGHTGEQVFQVAVFVFEEGLEGLLLVFRGVFFGVVGDVAGDVL